MIYYADPGKPVFGDPVRGNPVRGNKDSIYLRLSLTPRCNLRCRYCRPSGRAHEASLEGQLPDEDLLTLVERLNQQRPIHKLRFTGGEPLLRPGLVALIRRFRALLPEARLSITTNGVTLKETAEPLKAAGIEAMNISIDTLDPARFRRLTRTNGMNTSGLGSVLQGIEAAHRARFQTLKLNTVLMRSVNGDQLGRLIETAARFEAEIRFVELMPFGEGAGLFDEEFLSADEVLKTIKTTFSYLGKSTPSGTATRHQLRVNGKTVTVGFITPISNLFCDRCDRIRMDSYGKLYACLRAEQGSDLAEPLRAGREQDLDRAIQELLANKKTPAPGSIWPTRSMASLGG